jgi:hypothetical protein
MYKSFLLSDKKTFNYGKIVNLIENLNIETIINSAGYEDIKVYIHKKNVLMIANILTNIYYSINNKTPDTRCKLFSQNENKTIENKILTSEFGVILRSEIDEYNKSITKNETYTLNTSIDMNTNIQTIIDIVNRKEYPDKLEIVSIICKTLYFYIENGKVVNKILLDTDRYKQWCNEISTKKFSSVKKYMIVKWLKKVNYRNFLDKKYTEATYTKKTFNQDFFFFLISGLGSGKIQTVQGEPGAEVTITKQQIENYKKNVLRDIKYDLIREYTVIDFILKILKLRTNTKYIYKEESDLFTMLDIYYMYLNKRNV